MAWGAPPCSVRLPLLFGRSRRPWGEKQIFIMFTKHRFLMVSRPFSLHVFGPEITFFCTTVSKVEPIRTFKNNNNFAKTPIKDDQNKKHDEIKPALLMDLALKFPSWNSIVVGSLLKPFFGFNEHVYCFKITFSAILQVVASLFEVVLTTCKFV